MFGPLPLRRVRAQGRRSWRACVVATSSAIAICVLAAPTAQADPQSLASSLQNDPVQTIAVPSSSFTTLSRLQINALRLEIASLDPGRNWILVVSPRSSSELADLAQPVFNDLPAGALIAVAEDPANANSTNWWVGASWQPGGQSERQLNDVIQAYHRGQGSFFNDLRLEIRSFARGDAAAGHPSLASAGNPPPASTGSGGNSGSSGSGFPIALAVIGGIILLIVALGGGRYLRKAARASHVRHEKSADAHAQAQSDLVKLGEEITRLDIDSSLANASPQGKDEYQHAIGCYEAAERRLKDADDAYQFKKAQWAIEAGLRHVHAADQLFNPTRNPAQETEDLAQLAALHRSGALTDAEFAAEKAKLIN